MVTLYATLVVTLDPQKRCCCADVLYLLCVLCDCFQSGLYLLESGLQLTPHLTLCADLINLRNTSQIWMNYAKHPKEAQNAPNILTKHPPGPHHGADTQTEQA